MIIKLPKDAGFNLTFKPSASVIVSAEKMFFFFRVIVLIFQLVKCNVFIKKLFTAFYVSLSLKNDVQISKIYFICNKVMVSDGKYNDTASVSIKVLDVNDNYPYFDQAEFKFSILEVCYKCFLLFLFTTNYMVNNDIRDKLCQNHTPKRKVIS